MHVANYNTCAIIPFGRQASERNGVGPSNEPIC
jgi:hypothetical protein